MSSRSVKNISKLADALGKDIHDLEYCSENCPVYVWIVNTNYAVRVRPVAYPSAKNRKAGVISGYTYVADTMPYMVDDAKTYSGAVDSSEPESVRCYVGYDIEYIERDGEERIVSHQFYFAHNGRRKGVVLITEARFTQLALVNLIAEAVPDEVMRVYLTAHFSYAECSWLKAGKLIDRQEYRQLERKVNEPGFWYIDELKKRIEYLDKNNVDAKELLNDRFWGDKLSARVGRPIQTRDKKWVGRIGLYKRKERESFSEYLKTVNKKYTTKNKKAFIHQKQLKNGPKSCGKLKFEDDFIFKLIHKTAKQSGLDLEALTRKVVAVGSTKSYRKPEWMPIAMLNDECLAFLKSLHTVTVQRRKLVKVTSKHASYIADGRDRKRVDVGKKISGCPILPNRTLYFADSFDLLTGPLSSVGALMGSDKGDTVDLNGNKTDANGVEWISQMDRFYEVCEENFIGYGIRDAIIAGEAVAYFGSMFWEAEKLPLQMRAAGYSSKAFGAVYENIVAKERVKTKKALLGWETREEIVNGKKVKREWPGAAMEAFSMFYFGGWASSNVAGVHGKANYLDLKSAYPSAIAALNFDYNFGRSQVYYGHFAETMVDRLFKDGPFQIAGVCCSFRFMKEKDGRPVEPIFPIKVDSTLLPPMSISDAENLLIFPRQGHAHVSWPEFYTARRLGILEDCQIHYVFTFEKIVDYMTGNPLESELAKETARLLECRGERGNKAIYKQLLNFFYGKSSEGVRPKTVVTSKGVTAQRRLPGALTCFPVGAYTTSVTRASMGELLQKYDCYGLATDGFITPKATININEFEDDSICRQIHERIQVFTDYNETYIDANGDNKDGWMDKDGHVHDGKPYEYIETDFKADSSLFLKTRGYALVGAKNTPDDGKIKMAQMGVQVKERNKKSAVALEEFLGKLNDGIYTKESFQNLDKLFEQGGDNVPKKRKSEARVRKEFDLKRIPIVEGMHDDEFVFTAGTTAIKVPCVTFKTRPVETVEEFILMRQLGRQYRADSMKASDYEELVASLQRSGFGY